MMIIQHYSIALLATTFALLLSGYADNNAFAIDVTTNDADLQPHHGYMRGGCRGVVEEEDKTIPSAVRLTTPRCYWFDRYWS